MRTMDFKMERNCPVHVGDKVDLVEFNANMNYVYMMEPAVAMSSPVTAANRLKSFDGTIKEIKNMMITVEFE